MVDVGEEVELTKDRIGIIRYKGPLNGKNGIFYGIELTKGKGIHNGIFRGQRYFMAPKLKGVFVDKKQILYKLEKISAVGYEVKLTNYRYGIVRYKGKLDGDIYTEYYGVELTEGEGKHDGIINGKRYFNCLNGTGIMVKRGEILHFAKKSFGIKRIQKRINQIFKTNNDKYILSFGYIRKHDIRIPQEIVQYIVVYAFYDYDPKFWLYFRGDERFEIFDRKIVYKYKYVNDINIYGHDIVHKGQHQWKIFLWNSVKKKFGTKGTLKGVIIGIHSVWSKNDKYYGYKYDGMIMSHCGECREFPMRKNTVGFNENQVEIGVYLDFDEGIIGFSKNGKFLGFAFRNIEKTHYRLMINVCETKKLNVEMISYTNKITLFDDI